MSDGEYIIRTAACVAELPAAQWDALTDGANPFVSHAFLSLLEESGSVGGRSGWQPLPIVAEAPHGTLPGGLPAYLKHHNQGEYVFDHGWADAYERAGGNYYPKLQVAVPFTPVTGPRLLVKRGLHAEAASSRPPKKSAAATTWRRSTQPSSKMRRSMRSNARAG